MTRKYLMAAAATIIAVLLFAAPAFAGIVSGLPQSKSVKLVAWDTHRASYRINSEYVTSSGNGLIGTTLVLKGAVRDYAADKRKSCVDIEVDYTWDPGWERRQTKCDDFNPQGATNFTVKFPVEQSFPTGSELDKVRIRLRTDGGPLRDDYSTGWKTFEASP